MKLRNVSLIIILLITTACEPRNVNPQDASNKYHNLADFAQYGIVAVDELPFFSNLPLRVYGLYKQPVELRETSKRLPTLKKGDKLIILKRSEKKYKYWRSQNYFYQVKTKNSTIGWVYGLWINIGIDQKVNPPRTLFHAIKELNFSEIKKLIYNGADVNSWNDESHTPLILACKMRSYEIAKLLIDYGASVSAHGFSYIRPNNSYRVPNEECMTPLAFASYYGSFETVQYLVEKGAVLNAVDVHSQKNALIKACERRYFDIARYLVDKGIDINAKFYSGWNALMLCIHYGETEMAKYLIDKGAEINSQTGKIFRRYSEEVRLIPGTTPLMIASHHGNLDLVKYLLIKGADVNIKNEAGFNALKLAMDKGHIDVISILKKHNARDEATTGDLVKYVVKNDLVGVKNSLNNGAAIDGIINGYTPLMIASEKGFIGLVRYLISKGANINVIASTTALIQAINFGHKEIAKMLILKGADVNAYPSNFHFAGNAIFFAVKKKNLEIVKLLLKYAANVNVVNCNSTTPLFYADDIAIFKTLISAGANVNHENVNGYTPIMAEIMAGNLIKIKILLKAGAKLNHRNRYGETAYKIALQKNKYDIAKYLKSIGATE